MLKPPLKPVVVAADHKAMKPNASIVRHRIARVLAGRQYDEEGFSIVEFIIAITLLVIVLTATAQSFTSAVKVSGNTRARVVATNLATQALEQLRGLSANPNTFVTIPINSSSSTYPATGTLDGRVFTIKQDVTWVGVNIHGSACDASSSQGLVLRATELVTWPDMPAGTNVQSTTLLAPPIGAYGTDTGAAGIKVFSAAAGLMSGVVVSANSGGVTIAQVTTGLDGCAFFDRLNVPGGVPAAYTFSLALGSGVDLQENSSPVTTSSFSVAVGATVQKTISFDTGATIDYTYVFSPASPLTPPASNLSVSVTNPTLTQGFFPLLPTSLGAGVYGIGPAFPYPSGYSLFAGNCTDANPLGVNASLTPFYPGFAPAPPVVAVSPGATALAATVPLYLLNITLKDSSGNPVTVTNPTLTAQPKQPAPALPNAGHCPFGGTPTYTLTTPTASGNSATGVGLGHLTITASAKIGGSTKNGSATIWVQPNGIYLADPVSGALVPPIVYTYTAATFLPIRLS